MTQNNADGPPPRSVFSRTMVIVLCVLLLGCSILSMYLAISSINRWNQTKKLTLSETELFDSLLQTIESNDYSVHLPGDLRVASILQGRRTLDIINSANKKTSKCKGPVLLLLPPPVTTTPTTQDDDHSLHVLNSLLLRSILFLSLSEENGDDDNLLLHWETGNTTNKEEDKESETKSTGKILFRTPIPVIDENTDSPPVCILVQMILPKNNENTESPKLSYDIQITELVYDSVADRRRVIGFQYKKYCIPISVSDPIHSEPFFFDDAITGPVPFAWIAFGWIKQE